MKYSATYRKDIYESEYSLRCKDVIKRHIIKTIDEAFIEIMKAKNVDIDAAIIDYGDTLCSMIKDKLKDLSEEYFQNKIFYDCGLSLQCNRVFDTKKNCIITIQTLYSLFVIISYSNNSGVKFYTDAFTAVKNM